MSGNAQFRPVDCGPGNHEWAPEPLEDGSHYCENPGCAMFLFPDLDAVANTREAAEEFADRSLDTGTGP